MFDLKEYIQLLKDREFEDANQYRRINTPEYLYKYYYLLEDSTCVVSNKGGYCKKVHVKNEEKFKALEESKVWMPSFGNLNDPFEFKAIYLDKNRLTENGWNIESLEKIMNGIRKTRLLTCFSTNPYNNMPMWAHYANNHQGFCVEYKIENTDFIYPVSYETERIGIAASITNLIKELELKGTANPEHNESDLRFYTELILHSAAIKHKTWDYENEYRAIVINDTNETHGKLIEMGEIGIKPSGIYIGANCTSINQNRLKEISAKLNCCANKMVFDEYSGVFELSCKVI